MSLRFTDLSGFGENVTDLRSNLVLKLRSQVLKYLAPQALKAVHCETIGIFRSSVHVNILILSTQILGSLLSEFALLPTRTAFVFLPRSLNASCIRFSKRTGGI